MLEVPYLKRAYAAYHDKGFEIYGISLDSCLLYTSYQANLYGTFERTFAQDHNFKAMVGFNWETKFLKDVAATGYNLLDRKSTRLNSSHLKLSRMPSSA